MLLSGPSWPFLSCSQLGPDNIAYLAQIITPQNGIFVFCLKCAEIPIFIVFLNINQNRPKTWAKKNDNFSHFAKHRFIKNTVLLQPPFWPKIGVFQLWFFQPKTLMLNKKHNLKSGKRKDKKKGLKRKNKTENQTKEKRLMKKNVAI